MSSTNRSKTPTPDLDETINVSEAHGRSLRESAASVREKDFNGHGNDPVPLWIIIACAIALLIAGGVLGNAGTLFTYSSSVREGYVRGSAPGGEDAGPVPKPALAAFSSKGAKIYSSKCNGCHGADAKGDGANYPSLAGSDWVTGDTETLAMVILNGLQGPTSTGKVYGAGVMPSQAAGMTAEDLAGVMTYVRNSFGNSTGDIVTVEMATNALDISNSRARAGQPATAEEINAEHKKMLEGEPIDPTVLVNPATLSPE